LRRPASKPGPARRERGFALLIVLWTLALLALLTTQLTAAGRAQTQLAGNLRSAALLEAAADGGVSEAVFRVLQGAWLADGKPHEVSIGGVGVEVRVADEAGKINPNFSPPAVMESLLRNIGVEPGKAANLSAAIADWRTRGSQPRAGGAKLAQYKAAGTDWGPAGRPFESLDEMGLVLGMTPQIMARLRPYLSVFKEGEVQRAGAAPEAVQALDDADLAQQGPAPGLAFDSPNLVARVTAAARAPDGSFTRVAIVRMKKELLPDDPLYQILDWTEAAPAAR
jgi:general secretion pathway protein K